MKAQTIADIPVIGLIATITIVVFGILPPAIIKATLDKETVFTYEYEKTQYTLAALLSSTHNGIPVSQILAENVNNLDNLKFLSDELNSIARCYSLKIGSPDSFTTVVERGTCQKTYVFTTSITLRYNPDSAERIKLVRIEIG